jgi:hypothetical protein
MSNHLNQSKYKNEQILEQYYDGKILYIITKSDGKWGLYNHTEGKKLGTSKDYSVIREKIPNID